MVLWSSMLASPSFPGIGTVNSEIKKFNTHVKSLTSDLERRRQQSTDVLTNLFKGYKSASDKVFVE